MKNQEIAKIFYEIADYLETNKVDFRSNAYKKAGFNLETLEEGVEGIYKKGGTKALEEIPGVGKNIAAKIEEYIKTGKIKTHQKLKKELPIALEELLRIEGMGPKKTKVLYQKLGIRNPKDLEKAARARKISPLFGFGEKTEQNILQGIEFLKRSKGRFLLGYILPEVKEIIEKLRNLKEVKEISPAGSVRRMKETIGDVDFLVTIEESKKPAFAKTASFAEVSSATKAKSAGKIMDFFVSLPGVIKIWSKGTTKASVRMKDGFDMDIRVVPARSYGSALQYFTGSKEHNIATRKIAINKGLKLSEYGLFNGSKMIASETEKDVYRALGMDWIPPEMRESTGEIEVALGGKLPRVIGYDDIRGDLHCHSDWDGGANSIEELAAEAKKMGYEYLGIADHTKFLRIEHGLDERKLLAQRKEINKFNLKFKIENLKFRILQGCEANILSDGSIDIRDDVLAQLDFVIAGVHSQMKMAKSKMTARIIKAMENPNVDIISHPTGSLLQRRDEYQIDFEKILQVANKTGTILEINSSPDRLDLNDRNIRKAEEAGVKMVINTDAHRKDQLRSMELGIAQARRGWAERENIINTRSLNKLLKYFKQSY